MHLLAFKCTSFLLAASASRTPLLFSEWEEVVQGGYRYLKSLFLPLGPLMNYFI